MTIRPATRADRSQLIPLIRGYFAFYETPFPHPAKITALLDALESDGRLGVQLVAESNRRLVGFTSLYGCFDTLVADRILVMNDLFVEAGSRGSGRRRSSAGWGSGLRRRVRLRPSRLGNGARQSRCAALL